MALAPEDERKVKMMKVLNSELGNFEIRNASKLSVDASLKVKEPATV